MALTVRNLRGDVESESLIMIGEEGSKSRKVEMLLGSENGLWALDCGLKALGEPSKGMKSSWI